MAAQTNVEPIVLGTMRKVDDRHGANVPDSEAAPSSEARHNAAELELLESPDNALLNLPPPLPLRLEVSDLWVGVPDSKAVS